MYEAIHIQDFHDHLHQKKNKELTIQKVAFAQKTFQISGAT